MRAEAQAHVEAIRKSLELLAKRLDRNNADRRLEELNARIEDPSLWNDPARAQKLMRERQALIEAIQSYDKLAKELAENIGLIELAEAEGDAEIVAEAEEALAALAAQAREKELEALLDGEADQNDCFLEINAGAGGTESCDWAAMLARMYVRWAEKHGYEVELVDESPGEEAGIKSVTLSVKGPYAYGMLKSESGVHRLVRISPFDAARRRHTSFAAIEVLAEVDKEIQIDLREEDLKMEMYRSSGAGPKSQ